MQLSIFNFLENLSSNKKGSLTEKTIWTLFTDGASRNNPGISGAGIYILKNGDKFLQKSIYLGIKTNNQAEYLALIIGLYYINKEIIKEKDIIQINLDSNLIVNQIIGKFKIKNSNLLNFYYFVIDELSDTNYEINHISREKNSTADRLANIAIDQKVEPDDNLSIFLNKIILKN